MFARPARASAGSYQNDKFIKKKFLKGLLNGVVKGLLLTFKS